MLRVRVSFFLDVYVGTISLSRSIGIPWISCMGGVKTSLGHRHGTEGDGCCNTSKLKMSILKGSGTTDQQLGRLVSILSPSSTCLETGMYH